MTSTPQVQPPSVRSIYCRMRFGDQDLSTGTGFLAKTSNGHVFLTNRHNVTGRRNDTGEPLSKTGGVPDNLLIFHHMAEGLGSWQGRPEPLYSPDGAPLWKEHPVYGSRADFVALPLTNTSGVAFYPYELSEQPAIAICARRRSQCRRIPIRYGHRWAATDLGYWLHRERTASSTQRKRLAHLLCRLPEPPRPIRLGGDRPPLKRNGRA